MIASIQADRVAPSTASGYKGKGLPFWILFLDEDRHWSPDQLASADVYLPPERFPVADRVGILTLYAGWLLRTGRRTNLRFPALAHDLRLRLFIDTADLCSTPAVMVARNFGRKFTARDRSKQADTNDKLPLSGEMLYSMASIDWVDGLAGGPGGPGTGAFSMAKTDTAVYALMALCMCTWYVRIGNLVRTTSVTKLMGAQKAFEAVMAPVSAGITSDSNSGGALQAHSALLAEDVYVLPKGSYSWVSAFEFSWAPNRNRPSLSPVGEGPRSPTLPVDDRTIDAVAVCFRTGKTNMTADRSLKHEVRRCKSSPGKNLFLDMMGSFILFARWGSPGDLFFSRQHVQLIAYHKYSLGCPGDRNLSEVRAPANATGARYAYNSAGLVTLVKAVAIRYDLDPDDFSTTSCRKCGVSSMQAYLTQKSLARTSVATRSDHRTDSATQHYIYADLRGEETPLDLFNPKLKGAQLYAHANVVSLATVFRQSARNTPTAAAALGIPASSSPATGRKRATASQKAKRAAPKPSYRPQALYRRTK